MLLGRSVLVWIALAFVAVCVFVVAKWAIPALFGLVGFDVPEQIAVVLALLIAVGIIWGGAGWRRGPV